MSLQFDQPIIHFGNECCDLWRTWLASTAAQRLEKLKQAIRSCVQFLPALTINSYLDANPGDFGFHQPGNWSVNLNSLHSQANYILFDNFIEWATTPYHESRHAEQTFRIAQGVLSGEIELPGKGFSEQMQVLAGRSPRDIRQALETHKPLELNRATRVQTLQAWLKVPMPVVDFADTQRSQFGTYCHSQVPAWYQHRADPLKNAVIDWMKMSYDTQMRVIDRRAQNARSARGFGRMYQTLAEEKDAYGCEGYLQDRICRELHKTRPDDGYHAAPGLHKFWVTKTARAGHWRSGDLKGVDQALEVYEKQPTKSHLTQLGTVFAAWYTRNFKDRTARNVDNCIEDLKKYIIDALDYVDALPVAA
jgi:hypothetical protein